MGRIKRPYPLGKYRLRTPKEVDEKKPYPVDLEYTWNRKVIRKSMNVYVKLADWNQEQNLGRGGVRASYGPDAKKVNNLLLSKVEQIDAVLALYHKEHPDQITTEVIEKALQEKPLPLAKDGQDFVDFVLERLDSEYSRNKIGRSRYMNGRSGMNMFREFLRSTGKGTYKSDGIYLREVSVPLLEQYIKWRQDIKQNSDHTINHSLTPIIKACTYATELRIFDPMLNKHIAELRITPRVNLDKDTEEFDGKYLDRENMRKLIEYHDACKHPRRKEFIEMFLFAFHACGLRIIDVMTLQWGHINFEKKELRKILIKTSKRHTIPLSDAAVAILKEWKAKRPNSKYVFDLVKDSLELNDAEALYRARNNATKCINQSLTVVGEELGLGFNLTMHTARHTFAIFSFNKGLSMTVVSRLLGHGSTDITERIYAKFLPETLKNELGRINNDLLDFQL